MGIDDQIAKILDDVSNNKITLIQFKFKLDNLSVEEGVDLQNKVDVVIYYYIKSLKSINTFFFLFGFLLGAITLALIWR